MPFGHIRKFLDTFDQAFKKYQEAYGDDDKLNYNERDIIYFAEIYLAKALISDTDENGRKVARIILAAQDERNL